MDEPKDSMPASPEASKPESIKPESIKPESTTPEPLKAEPTTPPSAKAEVAKMDLPTVESPSISPAGPLADAEPDPARAVEPFFVARHPAIPRPGMFTLRPRQKRRALMAATVALAGAFGAIVGAAASGTFAPKPVVQTNVATLDDRKVLEQHIARLNSQVTTLKTNLEAANKTSSQQLAKINERADRFERNVNAELVTGSISPPQTMPAATASTPLPTPRPAPRIAAPEVKPPSRPQIIQDWAIREARDGYIYVQGHGDVYQIVPGAPLPGLGQVESIKRQDGRWVVTTPKGIIVSMRDRRYFE